MADLDAYVCYESATVYFPEWYKKASWPVMPSEEKPSISGRTISFSRKGLGITAELFLTSIPKKFSSNPEIQREIVRPAVALVSADLKTIDDLLPVFRNLAMNGVTQAQIYYTCDQLAGSFRVYDYSRQPIERLPFERLRALKSVPLVLVKKQFRDLLELAQHVGKPNQDATTLPYVKGNSLREAAERALQIYGWQARLAKLEI